eukprot:TRINITY_DN2348_c0_g1_i11.p1 TRINITY_DN2348_c0_g1~~TRINITY_DN2348_c0_g1_i11.p1  ORF type:complete len:168 (-),score=28.96 TRINITY_DN2348_c0_g1_i11:82-585(-)
MCIRDRVSTQSTWEYRKPNVVVHVGSVNLNEGILPPKEEVKMIPVPEANRKRSGAEIILAHDVAKKRSFDPLKNFFVLTTQSIVRTSPYMNQLGAIKYDALFLQVQKEQIPFFKWQNWINASVHSKLLGHSRRSGPSTAVSSQSIPCLLYTSPSPRDLSTSRMPSSA